jgi:hypothetical protein
METSQKPQVKAISMFQFVREFIEIVEDALSQCWSSISAPERESFDGHRQNYYSRVEDLEFYRFEAAINIWHNQAAIAFQQNDHEKCEAALHRKWQYQRRLAAYQRTEAPEKPAKPEEIFNLRKNA